MYYSGVKMFSPILPIFTKKTSNHYEYKHIDQFRYICVQFICGGINSIKLDLLEGIAEDGYDYKREFVTKYIYSSSIPCTEQYQWRI